MLPHEEMAIMTSEDPHLALRRSTLLYRERPANPSQFCATTTRRHPVAQERLRTHAAYRGEGHRSSREAGAFAAKAIPSKPTARRSEGSGNALQP